MVNRFRVSPGATARQLLTNLKTYKPLSNDEERRVIHAIESTGIPTDRVLADLSRDTLNAILDNI